MRAIAATVGDIENRKSKYLLNSSNLQIWPIMRAAWKEKIRSNFILKLIGIIKWSYPINIQKNTLKIDTTM